MSTILNRENEVCAGCSPDGTMAHLPCDHIVCYSCVVVRCQYNSDCPVCGVKLTCYSLGVRLTDDQSVERNVHEIFFFPQSRRVSYTKVLKDAHDPLYFAPSTKDCEKTRVNREAGLSHSDLYDYELRQIKSGNY